jgi:hypothetical protein
MVLDKILCDVCQVEWVDADVHQEELGMCLECSWDYWSHEDEE